MGGSPGEHHLWVRSLGAKMTMQVFSDWGENSRTLYVQVNQSLEAGGLWVEQASWDTGRPREGISWKLSTDSAGDRGRQGTTTNHMQKSGSTRAVHVSSRGLEVLQEFRC